MFPVAGTYRNLRVSETGSVSTGSSDEKTAALYHCLEMLFKYAGFEP